MNLLRSLFFISLLLPKLWAGDFRIQGNLFFDSTDLVALLALPQDFPNYPAETQTYWVNDRLKSLQTAYQLQGFFLAKPTVSNLEDTVVLNLFEGPRFRRTQTRYLGQVPVELKSPNDTLQQPKIEGYYNASEILAELDQTREWMLANGYLRSSIRDSMSLDTIRQLANIYFYTLSGPKSRLDTLEFEIRQNSSNTQGLTKASWLEKEFPIQKGSMISMSELQTYRSNLLNTGIFSQIRIEDQIDSAGKTKIRVHLNERVPGQYNLRGFYAFQGEHDPGIQGTLRHRNMFGQLHLFELEGLASYRTQKAGFTWSHPLWMGFPIRIENRLQWKQDLNQELPEDNSILYDLSEFSNRLSFQRRWKENWSLQLAGDLSRQSTDYPEFTLEERQTNGTIADLVDESKWMLQIEPSLMAQWVDNPIEPTEGWRTRLSLINGGDLFWRDRFRTFRLENRFYLPITSNFQWAFAADMGGFYSGSDEILARNYFLGSRNGLRGYDYVFPYTLEKRQDIDSTGQVVESVNIIASNAPRYLRASHEFRWAMFPFLKDFQGVQFVDWGQTWDPNPNFIQDEQMGVGFGVRYKIAVLTLRIDYTFKKRFKDVFEWEGWNSNRLTIDLSQAI